MDGGVVVVLVLVLLFGELGAHVFVFDDDVK